MKTRYIVGLVLFSLFIVVGIPLLVWTTRVETAGIKGRGDLEMTVQAAPNRWAQYNHFFSLCVSVQNAETTIDNETARLETETIPQERSHINANISAAHTTRANGINTYNADAQKYGAEQFKDSDLPEKLDPSPYQAGGTHTRCVV